MNQVMRAMPGLVNKIHCPKTISLSLESNRKLTMYSTLFKIKCEKGHKGNALLWGEETIQKYIESKKCNSCGSPIHHTSK